MFFGDGLETQQISKQKNEGLYEAEAEVVEQASNFPNVDPFSIKNDDN